jgi:hypothetical protein
MIADVAANATVFLTNAFHVTSSPTRPLPTVWTAPIATGAAS